MDTQKTQATWDTGNMGHKTQKKKKIKKNSMKHYITGIYCTNVHSNLK
jgi:hypothetical protein